MKKVMTNNAHIEGYLHEHNLEKKVSGAQSKNPGTEFINGTISIATDDEMLNVVQVHFSYVTAVTKNGKANATFNILQSIIDGKIGSVMEHGKENAGKLRVDTAINLNEWYDTRNNNQLVSVKRNEGGFVHQTAELCDENQRATFDVDMVITGVKRVEADPEKDTPEKVVVKGYIFNFRKAVLPVEFSVYEPYAPGAALDYFENLGATGKSPVFTRVQGNQISQTVVRKKEEESAFGGTIIKETRSSQRDFVITWAALETQEWDSEETILASELAEALAQREVDLADIKKRQDEYQATKNNALAGNKSSAASAPAKGDYDF